MKEKVFLDPNLLSYLAGRGKNFNDCFKKLNSLGSFVTDVKALQEIVYTYHLMGETDIGYEKAMMVRKCIPVFDITEKDLEIQEELLERYPNVRPRELLHVAVMLRNNVKRIVCSPESAYKEVEDITVDNIIGKIIDL